MWFYNWKESRKVGVFAGAEPFHIENAGDLGRADLPGGQQNVSPPFACAIHCALVMRCL
jgi:hypothetical protein